MLNRVPSRIPVFALGASLAALQACSGGGNGGGGGGGGIANDDTALVNEGQTVVIAVLDNDNNATSAALVSPPQNGSVVLNADNTFSYTHNSSDTTTDSFTYSASNGGGSSNATVNINIDNQPPAPVNECVTIRDNPNVTLDVLNGTLAATDPDDDPVSELTFSIDPNDDGTKGTAEIVDPNTGQFVYTLNDPNTFGPGDIRRGRDTFTYTIDDGQETATGTQTVIIDPRIMPLGDSITEGVEDGNDMPANNLRVGYRLRLRQLLAGQNFDTDFVGSRQYGQANQGFDADNEGHSGYTIEDIIISNIDEGVDPLYTTIGAALDLNPPDVILLHIGTNGDPDNAAAVDTLLDDIKAWEQANQPVAVLLARIIRKDTAGSNEDMFNDDLSDRAAFRVGNNDRLLVMDHNDVVLEGDMSADDIHPKLGGYENMAQVWFNGLRRVGFFGTLNTPTADFLEEVIASCP